MYVAADDVAPPSLLAGRPLGAGAIVVGVLVALSSHLGLPLLLMLIFFVAKVVTGATDDVRTPIDTRDVVVAHFIEKGVHFDPRHLPNRRVNRLSTAPRRDRVVVSKNMNPREPQETLDMGPTPENAQVAELLNIGDRAQIFAELAAAVEREGDPNGVEGGFATAQEGDLYLGQFVMFFRRGWSTPTVVDAETLQTLSATANVELSSDGHLTSFSITAGSGNALFDQSVLDRFEALRAADATIPEPPATVRDQYYGRTRSVRFNGRDAR